MQKREVIVFTLLVGSRTFAGPAETVSNFPGQHPAVTTMRPHGCTGLYPQAARKVNASGTTTVRFVIGTDGNISQPSVDKSSGNADLDQAALACVTQWHYIAARQNGVPVAVPWVAKVIWNPDEAEAPKSCADFYAGPPVAFDQIDGTTEIKAQI